MSRIRDQAAHIVRGLVAHLLTLYSGRTPQEVLSTDALNVFDEFGFREHLTPQRSNGLRSMVERIRADARQTLRRSLILASLLTRFLHANRVHPGSCQGQASLEDATLLPFPLLLAEAHFFASWERATANSARPSDIRPAGSIFRGIAPASCCTGCADGASAI